ncbi:hypothetical protein B0H12DRAFT_272818 [Mycena haematopus]|nr:hypothetical protein B0H12DRAFT_272818 [Mycena haematopus]
MSSSPAATDPKLLTQLVVSRISPGLIGSLLDFFFFGALLAQVYIYHVCFSKDSWTIKSLVYFLLFALTLDCCLNAADLSFWFVKSFGNFASFENPRFAVFYSTIMGSFIAMLVHFFFCFRIFVIRRTVWPVCILIVLLSTAQFVGGLGTGVHSYREEFKIHSFESHDVSSHQDQVLTDLIYFWLIGGAVADVLIAITMATLILKADMHSSTRDTAKDIVHLILETNTFSATVDLVALFVFVAFPDSSYLTCFGFIIPGIYANALLATLNNRAIILRKRTNEPYSGKIEMSLAVSGTDNVSGSVGTVRTAGNESVEGMTFEEPTADGQNLRQVRSRLSTSRNGGECESQCQGEGVMDQGENIFSERLNEIV